MLAWGLLACGSVKSDSNGTGDGDTDVPADVTESDSTSSDVPGDAAGDGWYSDECHVTSCQTHVYQCGDCEDNDGDGDIDSKDTDCLGPCDNNESGYNTGIPGGGSNPCHLDCYFDQDSGAGNDDCHWDHRCDPYEPLELNPCNYSIPCATCTCDEWLATQSDLCLEFCLPLVPNGCDCFGCCELDPDSEGEEIFYFIGSPGCSLDERDNCSQCTPVPGCYNECGPCELCLGRTELPPECFEEDRCPEGVQPCGLPGDDPCPEGYYCITGCCIATVI
jgi:hypothetical protein